jgi:peptide/nickel transport system permease protein
MVTMTDATLGTLQQDLVYQKPARTLWQDARRRLLRNHLAVFGLVVIVLFIFAALFGPYIAPKDFLAQDIRRQLQGPSSENWLGTDALGRDIFSRLLHGARTAALVALITTVISLAIGIALGTISGFLGGRVDGFIMWLTDVTMSVPGLLLAMLVNTALLYPVQRWFNDRYEATRNPMYLNTLWLDFVLVFGTLAFITWPEFARLIRGQVLSIGHMPYIEASRSMGAPPTVIMWRHIVPNAIGPVVVAVTQGMGAAIVLESSLSFLGIGVQPPNASWGSMLADSLKLWTSEPHLMIAPAATIGIISVAFVFVGDGLNDALNPRQK